MSKHALQGAIRQIIAKILPGGKSQTSVNAIFLGKDHILHVVEQPAGKPEYVSEMTGTVTNFQLAAQHGNIGLIAHNYLGGRYFSELQIGDRVFTMNGYKGSQAYRVTRILHFRALNPRSPHSDFIDLESGARRSANDVFRQIYTGSHHLVLQTCIERGANKEWGRLFIIAEPLVQGTRE
jgi:hypothetical protein